jgi:integrase/recombinase XerD
MADFVSKASAKSRDFVGLAFGKKCKQPRMSWSLYDTRGRRKYLVSKERWAFVRAALSMGGEVATFCTVLALTGARISEVLALTPERIDDGNCAINIETLKRRKKGIIRTVPVPRGLLALVERVHRYRAAQLDPIQAADRIWPWSRTTAWRRVKVVMKLANAPVFVSKPKALRHAFGAKATLNKVSLHMLKKWMGHAKLETTEIYAALIGAEERSLARLTWRRASKGFQH